jgi:CubicO group peptidase (beta-lactamase class C family)
VTGGDIEAHVDSSRLVFAPGAAWQYANNGVEVLSVLVQKLTGEQLDAYLDARLFAPLGIHSVSWSRDVRGVPFGDGEMSIRPLDLAKVGQLILDGGTWQGKPIVAPAWLDSSFAQSSAFEPTYGFLWWRIANVTAYGMTADMLAQWRAAGIPDSTLAKLQPIVGMSFPSYSAYVDAWGRRLTSAEFDAVGAILSAGDHLPYYRTLAIGPVLGYAAEGARGQFLVVIPAAHLVAVRMRRATAADRTSTTELDGYPTFPYDIARLVP